MRQCYCVVFGVSHEAARGNYNGFKFKASDGTATTFELKNATHFDAHIVVG
jgi:hypothetical protein